MASLASSSSSSSNSTSSMLPSIWDIAFSSCLDNGMAVSGIQVASIPNCPLTISIFPMIISGWSAKYWFMAMPSSFSQRCTQSGSMSITLSRFFKKRMSEVTSVPAFSLKAVLGSLIAPRSSALCARYFLTSGLFLSIVPFDVTNATTPPGLTLSKALAKK